MTTYHINPTIKKRWFKPPQLIYELIKYEEEDVWVDPTYGNGGGSYGIVKIETILFSSPSFEEVEELRKTLNKINGEEQNCT